MYLFNEFQSFLLAVNQGFDPIGGVQHTVGARPVPITFNQPNIELYPTQTTGLPTLSDPLSGLTVTTMPLSPASPFQPYVPQASIADYGALGVGALGVAGGIAKANPFAVGTALGSTVVSGALGNVAADLGHAVTPTPGQNAAGLIDLGMQNVQGQTMPYNAYPEVPASPSSFTLSSADPYSWLGTGWVDVWG